MSLDKAYKPGQLLVYITPKIRHVYLVKAVYNSGLVGLPGSYYIKPDSFNNTMPGIRYGFFMEAAFIFTPREFKYIGSY